MKKEAQTDQEKQNAIGNAGLQAMITEIEKQRDLMATRAAEAVGKIAALSVELDMVKKELEELKNGSKVKA